MRKDRRKRTGTQKYWVLKLYVTGVTRRSQRAVTNLKAICEEYLQGHYNLEVVDVYRTPELASKAGILVAPTLVRQLPLPVRRLTGDLSQRDQVLMLLDLKARDEGAD